MTNEEMQKTIEFILEQQAQFLTRIEKDEARVTRLEDAFVTLVRIAQISDERQDTLEERIGTLTEKLAALADAQALVDTKLAELAESQTHTEQRLNVLIDVVDRYISRKGDGNIENNKG